jgi:hypothetical protein
MKGKVFKGGLFMKRVGKNTMHVFSGLTFVPGTECGVALTLGAEYLLAGQPHPGTTAQQTTQVDINNCTLAKEWINVSASDRTWLRTVLAPSSNAICRETTPVCTSAPNCTALCGGNGGTTCSTNAFNGGGWCGPCQAWCIPNVYYTT